MAGSCPGVVSGANASIMLLFLYCTFMTFSYFPSAVARPQGQLLSRPPPKVELEKMEKSEIKQGSSRRRLMGEASPRAPRHVSAEDIHSSFLCFGRDYEKDFHRKQSCTFTDVCYYDGGFKFIVEDELEREYADKGGDFWVDLAPSGGYNIAEKGWEGVHTTKWRPEIVTKEEFAQHMGGAKVKVKVLPETHVYYISYNGENFGHFLSDELLPLYSVLSAFGELDYESVQLVRQPAMFKFSCDYQNKNWGPEQQVKCDRNYQAMTRLLTKKPILKTKDLVAVHNNETFCLDKLVAGVGMLSDHCTDKTTHGRRKNSEGCNQGRQDTLWQFREYSMNQIGVNPAVKVEKPKIVIWDRHVKDYKKERKVHKLPELKAELEKQFDVEVVIFEYWGDHTVDQQIGNVSESAIHITGPGSGSFIGWFLPRGSTQIRIYPETSVYHLEWFIFNYMPHMHVDHVYADMGKFDQDHVVELVRIALHRFHSMWEHEHRVGEV